MIMVQLLIIYRTFHSLRTADNLLKFSVCDKSKEKGNEFCIKLMCSIYLFIYGLTGMQKFLGKESYLSHRVINWGP